MPSFTADYRLVHQITPRLRARLGHMSKDDPEYYLNVHCPECGQATHAGGILFNYRHVLTCGCASEVPANEKFVVTVDDRPITVPLSFTAAQSQVKQMAAEWRAKGKAFTAPWEYVGQWASLKDRVPRRYRLQRNGRLVREISLVVAEEE